MIHLYPLFILKQSLKNNEKERREKKHVHVDVRHLAIFQGKKTTERKEKRIYVSEKKMKLNK